MRYAALPGYCFIINCKLVYIELRGPVIGFRLMRKLIIWPRPSLGLMKFSCFPPISTRIFNWIYTLRWQNTPLCLKHLLCNLKALSVARSGVTWRQRECETEGERGELRFDFDSFLMKANEGKFHFKSLHEKNVNVQWTNVVFVVALRVCVCVCFMCLQVATRVAQFGERNVIFWWKSKASAASNAQWNEGDTQIEIVIPWQIYCKWDILIWRIRQNIYRFLHGKNF